MARTNKYKVLVPPKNTTIIDNQVTVRRKQADKDEVYQSFKREKKIISEEIVSFVPSQESAKRLEHVFSKGLNKIANATTPINPFFTTELNNVAKSLVYSSSVPGSLGIRTRLRLYLGKIDNIDDHMTNLFDILDLSGQPLILSVHGYFVSTRLMSLRYTRFPIYNFRIDYALLYSNSTSPSIPDVEYYNPKEAVTIIRENLKNEVNFREYIMNHSFEDIVYKLLQVFLALDNANRKLNFTHYHLSVDEILLYKVSDGDYYMQYEKPSGDLVSLYNNDGYIVSINHLDYSFITYNQQNYVSSYILTGASQLDDSYPLYDLFSVLMSAYDVVENSQSNYKQEVTDGLLNMLKSFGITKTNISNVLEIVKPYYYGLIWTDTGLKSIKLSIIDYLYNIPELVSYLDFIYEEGAILSCSVDGIKCVQPNEIANIRDNAVGFETIDNFYDMRDIITSLDNNQQIEVVFKRFDLNGALYIFDNEGVKYLSVLSTYDQFEVDVYDLLESFHKLVNYWNNSMWLIESMYTGLFIMQKMNRIDEMIQFESWLGIAKERHNLIISDVEVLNEYNSEIGDGDITHFVNIVRSNTDNVDKL